MGFTHQVVDSHLQARPERIVAEKIGGIGPFHSFDGLVRDPAPGIMWHGLTVAHQIGRIGGKANNFANIPLVLLAGTPDFAPWRKGHLDRDPLNVFDRNFHNWLSLWNGLWQQI